MAKDKGGREEEREGEGERERARVRARERDPLRKFLKLQGRDST